MAVSRTLAVVMLALVFGSTMLLAADPPTAQPAAKGKVRIGTYDNRAVAVAYAASRFNPVREKAAEQDAAKRAGDKEKLKALEAWGERHQRMLHVQAFCRVPVTDLLEPVSEKLRALVKEQDLAAIVMSCDVAAPDVELVDVTEQVVELFEPSAKTRQVAQKVRGAKPASLLDVAAAPARH